MAVIENAVRATPEPEAARRQSGGGAVAINLSGWYYLFKGVTGMKILKRQAILLGAALCFTLMAGSLVAQLVTASLQGVVRDPTGAVVPNAKVEITNTSTNVKTTATTNSEGFFIAPSLQPGGPYIVVVEASGFKKEERSGITLLVNQSASIEVQLQVGMASETVRVTGEAPQLETTTAAMGQVVDARSIVNLPLNQRNAYSLVFLAPGVQGSVNANFNGQNISMNGGRPGSSEILVDGIPAAPGLVNPIQGFAVFPSVESVQEFKVQTNNYSAEFGRSGSGVVNLIYRSGTNQFHGSAFDFLRNSNLDSNNYFSNRNGVPLPNFKRNQFGGSLGGPLSIPKVYDARDKTFFFIAYEGLRQGTGAQLTTSVPTALQRAGNFSQTFNAAGQQVVIYDPTTTTQQGTGYVRSPFPGNLIPASEISPVAANVMKYYALPNRPGAVNSGLNNYFAAANSVLNSDTGDAKFDENINDRNRFFFRYSQRDLLQPTPAYFAPAQAIAQNNAQTTTQVSHSAAFDYTFTASPTLLMEFRYGLSRMAVAQSTVSDGFDPTSLGLPSYIAAHADHLIFPGFAPANYYSLGQPGMGAWKRAGFESHLLGANFTKVVRDHVLKFGWEGRLLRVNDIESGSSTGNFTFTPAITQGPNPNAASSTGGNSLASLLLGVGSGSMVQSSKDAATQSFYHGLYFQDDWKLSSKLTVNLGIRYDLDIPRTERYNRMETFNPYIASPLAAQAGIQGLMGGLVFPGVNGASRRQFEPRYNDFSPRIGLAYQALKNTVIRAGYGMFFAPSYREAGATIGNQGFSAVTVYNGAPNGLTPSLYIDNPFPKGFNPIVGSSQGLLSGLGASFETPITGDNKVAYMQNWDFEIQQQLPLNLLVDVAYVGSHGVNLNKSGENDWNINQLTTQALALGTGLQQSVPNPFYHIITTGPESGATIPLSYLMTPYPQFIGPQGSYMTGGYSLYHAIQLKVEKRFSHGLSVLVAFTGQKLIDDYAIISNVGNNTGGIQNIYNGHGEAGVSSNDISNRLVISGVYNLPFGRGQTFGKNWNKAVDAFLGGWQMNGIATNESGFPLSLTTQNTSNSGSNVLRPNNNGTDPNLSTPISSRLNRYLNTSTFSQPAPFTFGNLTRTLPNVRRPGQQNIDFSLFKNFSFVERLTLQFRAEAFNLLNQVVFGVPNSVLSSGQFGVITSQANAPRTIQFGLKLLF